jgi:anti-sigma B factor antagonist
MIPRGMALLDLTADERGDAIVVALTGELDISSAGRVEQALERAETRRPAVLVLDLSGLVFMDSTGLRIVMRADARARERGGRLTVVRGPEPVQRVFRITRLDERLTMADSADEAGAAAA